MHLIDRLMLPWKTAPGSGLTATAAPNGTSVLNAGATGGEWSIAVLEDMLRIIETLDDINRIVTRIEENQESALLAARAIEQRGQEHAILAARSKKQTARPEGA
jgi:hypothetical protein